MKRAKLVLAVALCTVTALPGTARAEAAEAQAEAAGTVGAVNVTVGGVATQAGPLAPCETGGTASGTIAATTIAGTVKFGDGSSTCTRNADGTAKAEVSGSRFDTSILQPYGGPRITARTFGAGCETGAGGSSGSMKLAEVTGITVPTNIPTGYTVVIPGTNPEGAPIAEVVLNELTTPSLPDGSLTETALHIKLFPQGGPDSGDILVGSAHCDPAGD